MSDPMLALLRHYPTCWREGKSNKKPRSRDMLRADRWTAVDRLYKYCGGDPCAQELAQALYDCTPDNNCNRPPCPECGRKGQSWFAREMNSLSKAWEQECSFVTLISPDQVQWGAAKPVSIINHMRSELRNACKEAGLSFAVFALDISCNSSVDNRQSSILQPHWHGVVISDELEANRAPFDALCPSKYSNDSPVQAKPFDGDPRVFAYMADIPNERRLTVPPSKTESGSKCQNTVTDDLHAAEHARMMLLLDKIGFKRRLLLHGASFKRCPKGCPKIEIKNR